MAAMIKLILRRIALMVPMFLGVTLLVFVVMEFSPVDPARSALGDAASEEQLDAFREANGLNDPIVVRYVTMLKNLTQLNFGRTLPPQKDVAEVIKDALPITAQIAGVGLLIAVIASVVLGTLAALYRDRWVDQLIRLVSLLGVSLPTFWLAILMIQEFAVGLGWLPSGGFVPLSVNPEAWAKSIIMPAVSVAVVVAASLTRIVRTSVVEELDRDYVRTAVGSGVPYPVVVAKNVMRNALINPLTVLGLRIGMLIGGTVVVEAIFTIPGMGSVILRAVTTGDTNLVQGAVLTIALVFMVVNLIVDILYAVVNPRMRSGH
ncbi:ABC transporter permease [Corynebacterium sp. 13CS0277]|uniref:ABC transporter permease n=1 Tax=Corynebacterium sp. 13CS0277 TaxID=2071994 RepID=UPI000D037FB9|nr:ABC transporter permease [Corynebacterium sp. 13CS0277]PRQ12606.1 ABC transporter permease [Corynebacterium sp. 13CS0277]